MPPKVNMIAKSCPKCDQQIPVACKNCPCGHIFFSARKGEKQSKNSSGSNSSSSSNSNQVQDPIDEQSANQADEGETKRRRTERIRREKPDYYDPLQYEKQTKLIKVRNPRGGVGNRFSPRKLNQDDGDDNRKRKRKRKPKTLIVKSQNADSQEPLQPDEEEDLMQNISPEKTVVYSIILAEINRKLSLAGWNQV